MLGIFVICLALICGCVAPTSIDNNINKPKPITKLVEVYDSDFKNGEWRVPKGWKLIAYQNQTRHYANISSEVILVLLEKQ